METKEFFDDVLELIDTYIDMINKQNEIIAVLRQENKMLKKELNLPSHIITSPPTPFSVDTCENNPV
tara:strand:+ start:190 stop:390 length:201 start_codon:yes stop_codon:yes gene_type:complete